MQIGPYLVGPNDTEENGIYIGDCAELIRAIPDSSIDLVLTDPPYGTVDGRGKVIKRGNQLIVFNPGDWDIELPIEWISYAMRVLRLGHWISVFTDKLSVKTIWDTVEAAGGRGKQTFYWIKNNPPPQPRMNWASGIETAVLATRGAVTHWFGGGWKLNYFREPIVSNSKRTGHPTQKPVRLMKYLLSAMSAPGDIVLDPFLGSGTTAVAAVQTGRQYLAFEIDPGYAETARRRARLAQPPLFLPESVPSNLSQLELI